MHGIHLTKRSSDCMKPTCQQKKTDFINFGERTILRGCCIKHSDNNHTTYSGVDLDSGKMVIIIEWNVQIKSKNESLIQKRIERIERELNNLQRLRKPNLADYYGMKYITNGKKITVYLLKEFIFGCNCYNLIINQNIKTDIKFLKHIAKGALEALDYLHKNDIFHGYLKGSFVYVNDLGEVKISNHSIHRRLMDLQVRDDECSKEADIFRLGILLLSLSQGQHVSRKEFEIPPTIDANLYDFLTKCLSKNENDRYTTTQLLNHNLFQEEAIPLLPRVYQKEKTDIPKNSSLGVIQYDQQLPRLSFPNGQSRIESEFEILEGLGKGGFGEVIKVKKKLDNRYYAIKIIKLKPNNKLLYKKMIREVHLFSRLNHENVVRYYNSWIESTVIKGDTGVTTDSSDKDSVDTTEISVTYDSELFSAEQMTVDDDEDDDITPMMKESDSDEIVFAQNLDVGSRNARSNLEHLDVPHFTRNIIKETMYIQMEFCENNTLRTVIDNNLYLDRTRIKRLFREIVEGLAHIHKQGMIHRDLKPENIFLDCEDHVKIGDFGLATIMKSNQNDNNILESGLQSMKDVSVYGSGTGVVGTTLYNAPEITSSVKVRYDEKSDIYSLGIILFEMCYRPFPTKMERIEILTRLRQKEVIFPYDFAIMKIKKLSLLIKLLLNHDLSERPDSKELLDSELMPLQVQIDKLKTLVRDSLLISPRFEGYKFIIASCFQQPVRAIQDSTYDKGTTIRKMTVPSHLHEVEKVCQKIFDRHGGQNMTTPLLMPKSKFYDSVDSCVKLVTQSGSIVSLRHDLRVPFARFVASNNITSLRRYSIEKVFRERKNKTPRETYEGAFDIVSPNKDALLYDAEVIYIICEILHEIPDIKNKQFVIEINHTMLLNAIFLHYGISEDKHIELITIISEVKSGKVSETKLREHLLTSGVSEMMISSLLLIFIQTHSSIAFANIQFGMMSEKVVQLANEARQDLDKIVHSAKAFGVKYDIEISPGLVHNANQYSGMMFQFVCKSKSKGTYSNMDVLASGGRYDSMIASHRSTKGLQQFAVGVSISLTRLVQEIKKKQPQEMCLHNHVDVVVHSIDDRRVNEIMRNLWTEGIRSILIEGANMKETKKQTDVLEVLYEVILNDDGCDKIIVNESNKARSHITASQLSHILQRTSNNN